MIIVLLGPPGAGKGTQGERLAQELSIPKIATGDVLRAAVRDGTPLGLAAKAAMDRGDLVPDDVILGIMKEAMTSPATAKGAILDGVVRTVPQAEGLSRALGEIGRAIDAVVVVEVPDDVLVDRLSGRTVCGTCQTPYTGMAPGTVCPKGDGGVLSRRKDDEPEAVRNRLQVYQNQTAPVIAWYKASGAPLRFVDGVGTLDEVLARFRQALSL